MEEILDEADTLDGDIHDKAAHVLVALGTSKTLDKRGELVRRAYAAVYGRAGWTLPDDRSPTLEVLVADILDGLPRDVIAVRLRLHLRRAREQ